MLVSSQRPEEAFHPQKQANKEKNHSRDVPRKFCLVVGPTGGSLALN